MPSPETWTALHLLIGYSFSNSLLSTHHVLGAGCWEQGWGCPAAHQSPPQQLLTGPGSTHGAEEAGLGESSTPRGGSLWKNTALCIHGTWRGLCHHSGSVLGQVPRPSKVQGRVSAVLEHSFSCSGCGVTWSCALTTLLTFLRASCNRHRGDAPQVI